MRLVSAVKQGKCSVTPSKDTNQEHFLPFFCCFCFVCFPAESSSVEQLLLQSWTQTPFKCLNWQDAHIWMRRHGRLINNYSRLSFHPEQHSWLNICQNREPRRVDGPAASWVKPSCLLSEAGLFRLHWVWERKQVSCLHSVNSFCTGL